MKILSIISQKGGVGKTTVATCLAVAAEKDKKKTAVFDLDPQATASFWKDTRKADTPAVLSLQAIRLPAMIKAAKEAGTDLVIIDGAAVARDIAYEAAKVADFVLIPTKAAVFDIKSMMHTIEIVKQLKKPFSILQNFVPPAGNETKEAEQVAQNIDAEICTVTLGNRKSFFRAQGQGLAVQEFEPNGKAAQEVIQLYKHTKKQLYKESS